MDKYLNSPIKEVITAFPEVGKILEEYRIGCVPCAIGSCLLKDIIDIHQLSAEQGRELLGRIAKVIFPDRPVELPLIETKTKAKPQQAAYSPPMKRLVDEHMLIKKWAAMIPEVLRRLDVESARDRELLLEGVYFIRNYADKYHHAKEEEILFKYFDENSDILKVMLEDHRKARGHARAIEEAVGKKDQQAVSEHLRAYGELLADHIRREDEILYPWMDGNLSTKQVGELFSKFGEADEAANRGTIQKCINFITHLEARLQRERKESKP